MDTNCALVAAGYPALAIAIVVLWKAYQKSQRALLAEKEAKARILERIRDMMRGG